MEGRIVVGTRKSNLALIQAQEIIEPLRYLRPGLDIQYLGIDTRGDRDRTTPISEIEGTDFFTLELDVAVREGVIDMAVHSAKDLPDRMPPGLEVTLLTRRREPFDCFVSRDGIRLKDLPRGARVGTSSRRRKDQLRRYRRDLEIVDIRGTIEERLMLLEDTGRDLAGIIIAAVALVRLGLEHCITERLPLDIFRPHPLQGSLAVVIRKDRRELAELLKCVEGVIHGSG